MRINSIDTHTHRHSCAHNAHTHTHNSTTDQIASNEFLAHYWMLACIAFSSILVGNTVRGAYNIDERIIDSTQNSIACIL